MCAKVVLEADHATAARCKCGRWYNLFGQSLIDPKYWEDAEAVTEEITTEETAAEDLDESQITEETTGEVVEEVVDAPTDTVWVWDIRFDGPDAESWTSLDTGIFFTSKEEAISAALHHLDELADEGELLAPDGESFADPMDFVVDAFEVAAKDIPTVSE